MKHFMIWAFLLLPLGAFTQKTADPMPTEQHYIYIEALMPYNENGNPGKPFLHIGEIAKNLLGNWRDLELKVEEYQSTMDVLNYLDEQGFELTNRVLFTYPDGITESFILRRAR
jgi:hypothetical protein